MRKSRAIFLLITTLIVIAAYVAWAVWEPPLPLQSIYYDENVDAVARSSVEADLRSDPPKARKLTWQRFLNRLANPYQLREEPWILVSIVPDSSGDKMVAIYHTDEHIYFEHGRKDGKWRRESSSGPDL